MDGVSKAKVPSVWKGEGRVWIIQFVKCCQKYSGIESERTVFNCRKEKKRNLFSFVHILLKAGA